MTAEGKPQPDDILTPRRVPAASSAAPSNAGLPFDTGRGQTLGDQRDELRVQIDELQGTLRFMGKDHPRRAETEAQLRQVRSLLDQIEKAMPSP